MAGGWLMSISGSERVTQLSAAGPPTQVAVQACSRGAAQLCIRVSGRGRELSNGAAAWRIVGHSVPYNYHQVVLRRCAKRLAQAETGRGRLVQQSGPGRRLLWRAGERAGGEQVGGRAAGRAAQGPHVGASVHSGAPVQQQPGHLQVATATCVRQRCAPPLHAPQAAHMAHVDTPAATRMADGQCQSAAARE